MKRSGSCLCGKQRYILNGTPLSQGTCYCRDCQKAGGAEGSPLLVLRSSDLDCERSSLSVFESTNDEGRHVRRFFCPNCGSPVFAEIVEIPGLLTLKASGLDEPGDFVPQYLVWTRSARPSTAFPVGVPRFEKAAPLPLVLGASM